MEMMINLMKTNQGKFKGTAACSFKLQKVVIFKGSKNAEDNDEFPALMDGGADTSVTNNEDLLVNIKESTTILEGFNGAAAKAQGQGELLFSTPCHITV